MFDLVEEELLEKDQKKEVHEIQPKLPVDSVIFTMPDKFRKREKSSSGSLFIIIGILVVVVIATIGGAIYLLIGQTRTSFFVPKQKQDEAKQEPKKEETKPQNQDQSSIPQNLLSPEATSTQPVAQNSLQQQQSPSNSVAPSQQQPSSQVLPTQQSAVSGKDSDGDSVTDKEEGVWQTDPLKPDTDGDGFRDDEELLNLYDPTQGSRAKLIDSSIAHVYKNKLFNYSFLYPTKMLASPSNNSEKEVILSSSTGELISITVKDNPQRLFALDWYKTEVTKNGSTDETTQLSGADLQGVVSPDGRTVFITPFNASQQVSRPIIIILSYNLNSQTEMNFLTTFKMLIKSFSFVE